MANSLARITVMLATTIAGASTQAAAGDWPQFRGPTGQGDATGADPPIHWSQTQNVAWRRPIEGKGWSSPIVYGERIFLTTAIELPTADEVQSTAAVGSGSAEKPRAASPPLSLRAVAVDATSGAIVWEREVFRSAAGELPLPHAKNSYASPTPITDGESIYVHFGPAGTAALSMEGDVRWENRRIAYDARHGGGGSPVIAGDSLVFNCDGVVDPFVVALNRRTGAELWRTPRRPMDPERFAFATPLVIPRGGANGGLQVVSPGSHMVGSYDPQTGRELWHVRFENKWSVVPRPVFADGLVLACTGYEGPAELLAIRPEGTGDVTSSHIAWRHDQFVPHTPSPLVVDGRIYTVSDAGVAACTELATGKVVGKRRLGGNFSASPLSAGGRLYFPDEEGMCYVLAAEPSLKQLAANDLEEPIFASFAVVDDRALLIRTSEALYRIEAPK